jgi:hypothetical protein
MNRLFGFGSPLATAVWAVSLGIVLAWSLRLLVERRLVTVMSYTVFFFFFLPIILQYPFTFSPINTLAVGLSGFPSYVPHVDPAFLVSTAGMATFVLGAAIAGRRPAPFVPLRFVSAGLRVWSQDTFLWLTSGFNIVLFALLAGAGFLGEGGARNIAQGHPVLRPLYNVAHVILPLTIALDLLVAIGHGRRWIIALAGANFALGLLTGARGVVLGGVFFFALTALAYPSLRRRLPVRTVVKAVPVALVTLLLAFYISDVREGRYNFALTVLTFGGKMFYGNNFSDLRDFAWVRSAWNGELFFGKTQLAGLLAFMPSAISSFRSEWNWGVVTTTLAGLDPTVTPGLRAGAFGETYFNFGLPGVLIAGLLYGYLTKRLHAATVFAVETREPAEAKLQLLAAFVTANLFAGLLNTAGFYGLYLTIGVLLLLLALDFVVRTLRRPVPGHEPLREGGPLPHTPPPAR